MEFNKPQYVGDGVYALHDGYQVWIWATDGIHSTARIALNPDTFQSLYAFARQDPNFKVSDGNGDFT